MILSVGYRVKSNKGIMFRRWANKVLKEYTLKGYAINQRRLEYLEKTVKLIDIASRVDKELKGKIAAEATIPFNASTIESATALVAVNVAKKRCGYERDGSFSTTKEDSWQMFDAGVASQTFCLAAHEYGVSSVIMGILDYEKVAEMIELPEDREMVALIAIGYPAESPEAPKRKSVEDLLTIK